MKRIIVLLTCLACLASLAWASGQGTGTGTTAGGTTAPTKFSEAPMLKEQVSAGKLPPVDQRLPEKPRVQPTRSEVGKYGGPVFHNVDMGWLVNVCFETVEPLIEGDPTFSDNLVGNLAESFSANADATVFTFYLRKGTKWSDGVELTTDDVRFRWEDVYLNKDLTTQFPSDLTMKGQPCTLEIVDKYTFRIKTPYPWGSFLGWMSNHYRFYQTFILPKHYLSQFHTKYTPLEKLEPLIKQEGFEKGEWTKLFNRKVSGLYPHDVNADIGVPVLTPWMVESKPSPNVRTLVRNPYYWKVDQAGNQLPYIDRMTSELFSEPKPILAKILAGEADVVPEMSKFSDLPVLKQNQATGGYRICIVQNWMTTWTVFFPNLTNEEDPVLTKLLNDVRFRRALSLAIDRKPISDTLFLGYSKPIGIQPLPGSRYMPPGKIEDYSAYDPARANALLDEMGLKKGADGIRLRSDGKKLTLPVEYFEVNPYNTQTCEMVVKYWRDIGIDATMKIILAGLWFQNNSANKTVMSIWHHAAATDKEIWMDGGGAWCWWAPTIEISWGPRWGRWFTTNGKEGVEPPAEIKDLAAKVDIIKYGADEKARTAAGQALVKSMMENVWMIGTGSAPCVLIVNDKLGNMPEKTPDYSFLTMAAPYDLEQVYWKK